MSSITSLERVPRPGLRSAVSPAIAPARSLSQGAPTSRLSADAAAHDNSRLPNAASTAFVDVGSPHRPRVRTPATPATGRDSATDLHIRTSQLEAENSGLRDRLALATQLAESAQRYAALQASTDATIQALLRDREPRASPAQPQLAVDDNPHALNLCMTNLSNFVANPVLVANVALGTVVNVKRVNDACTALLRLLGTLRGATEYDRYLRYILQLPKPGAGEPGTAFADSAICGTLDIMFHNDARPASPEGSVSSVSASGNSCQRLIAARADRVASVFAGDVAPGGSDPRLLDSLKVVDSLLFPHLAHLISAVPGTAVYDGVASAITFIGAMAALLRCAGHGVDQERQLRYERAFGPCMRHTHNAAAGGVPDLTTEQLAEIIAFDYQNRLNNVKKIDLSDMVRRFVVMGLPKTTGGSRRDVVTAFTQAIMPPEADATDPDTLATRLAAVVDKFRNVTLNGAYTPSDPADLCKVLYASPAPRPAMAAAAVRTGPDAPKPANRKGQPHQPPTAAAKPATGQPAAPSDTPPPGRQRCPLGDRCRGTTMGPDPLRPDLLEILTRCSRWHPQVEYLAIMQATRAEYAAASLKPVLPTALPVSPGPPIAPTAPPRGSQAEVIQSFISEHRPGKPSAPALCPENPLDVTQMAVGGGGLALPDCSAQAAAIEAFVYEHSPGRLSAPAVRPTDADLDVLQAALDGYQLALAECAADARSISGGDKPLHYHRDLLLMYETYIASLAAGLSVYDGVALLATATKVKDKFILDTGSFYNLGPHLPPDGLPDTPGAASELRASLSIRHTQTAGGGTLSLGATFDSQVLVRTQCGQLISLEWQANHVPGLRTKGRALHVVSGANLFDNEGEMINRPLRKGGPHFRVMTTDPQHPAEPPFLSGRIDLDYSELGAAQFSVAIRQTGEHHHVAVLRPSAPSGTGPAALAVLLALQTAHMPLPTDSLHLAMAAVHMPEPDPVPVLRLQQFVADQHLLHRAEEIVEIVRIYPVFDPLDAELPRDQYYDVTPDYFGWDDRTSGGVFRRMIQRSCRRWVNQLPALTYGWLGCTAAQLLAELEQQLSLLVQGLVKARSDAVDGDGAIPATGTATTAPTHPAVLALDQLPPNSPITPLSHDDDSSEEDDTVASAVHVPEPAPVAVAPLLSAPAVAPADTASSTPDPTGCKAQPVLPKDRREPDGDDGDLTDGSTSVSRKRTKSAPTSAAASAGTSASGSGTAAEHATDLSWLTDTERDTIAHHEWSADIYLRKEATDTVVSDAITMPAVKPDDDVADDDDHRPAIAGGLYRTLATVDGPVSWTPRRPGPAATTAVLFALCMCVHQLPGRPCLGRPTPGSAVCADCLECSDGLPCVNSARPPFCSAVAPSTRYHWPPGTTKAVFLDPAAGHLSYTIARLLERETAVALAWDIHPPEVALADVLLAYPHLLPRVVYAQVLPGTLVTPALVTDMLASLCDATITDVVELMCGPCCTTTSCRSGKRQNPHRRRIDGVLRPVTYEAALADVFYSSLFDTVRHIRSVNPRCSFILENPADGLLRELPQVQALLADMPAHFVVHDHCVLSTEPIDRWHGSTQKPTQYIAIGYDAADLPASLRCAKLGCEHRLSFDADACHRLVQQLPAKRRRQDGQVRVSATSAARIPVGVFKYAFPLAARLQPAPTSVPPLPEPAAVPPSPPVDLEPYGAYLSLRAPPDHRLQRLTPLTCVYDATTLHAVCGHTLRGQRLADSANHWQDFRMLGPSGQVLSAPNITAADVRLDAHCDVCTRTQMQAAPSHRAHPRAGRRLPVSIPCLAPFGLADIATPFLRTDGPWYSEPVPIPSWGQWLQPAAACSTPSPVAMPAPAADRASAPDEGETCLSDSSGYDTPTPGRCPTSSDSDPEAERDVNTVPTFPTVSDRIFTHPNALGTDCRTFEALEMLPDHMRKGRIVHFDIVHSELASPSRPLKAGIKSFLVCVDVGIHHVGFRPIRSTKDITNAYKELAIELGWTTQRHTCHCVTDGEPGLMAPVRAAAAAMGQSFDTLPPYAANANHAGSLIIKHVRAAVRGYALGASDHPMSVIDGSFEAYAWAQAVLIYNMTSILGHPLHYSPYRLAHGIHPVFTSIPFGAKVYIHIPKDSRLGARVRGDNSAANRSEPGVAIGPRSQQDPLPVILTSRNTTKSSRTTYLAPVDSPLGVLGIVPPPVPVSVAAHVDAAIAAVGEQVQHHRHVRHVQRALNNMLTAHDASVVLSPGALIDRAKPYIAQRCKNVLGLSVAAALNSTFPATDGSDLPYRRADLQWDLDHNYLVATLAASSEETPEHYDSECAQVAHLACMALPDSGVDPVTYACSVPEQRARIDALVAIVAMTDLPWKVYLNGPERDLVIAAWYRELNALLDLKAIVPLIPGSPDWEEAVKSKTTTPCRVLLDFKRDGTWKCRVVTRGDLEDKVALDGPDFHYYSNVSRMSTVRCTALRAGRDMPRPGRTGGRVLSSCDIANAFLQTTPFPENERRFLMIRSPIDGTVTYYRQLVSVYGSCSASARWETTFSSWLCSPESEGGPGLVRGMNEPSAYYHPGRDLLMVLYTDDQLLDGYKEDIDWYYTLLRARFKIKEPKWLTPDNPIDHLGVTIFQTDSHTYMTMQNYIRSMNIVLQRDVSKCLHRKSPMPHKHEIVDLTPLSHTKEAFFVRALGMCSWISATVRLDGRYAQSRISQYASAPCVGAYNALIHLLDYYTVTSHLCIRQSRSATSDWSFYSDSDMAGNPEVVCKRRSQLGYIGLVGEAPIVWSSKCTTVQFAAHSVPAGFAWGRPVVAHPDIADNHADVSSAAAEIYAMGTATMDILALSYVCSEAGILFPRTFVLQVDNAAAQAFASQTTYSGKSRLRHVDARQEWVQVLRDSQLVKAVHVDTTENLSDLFTKALDLATFTRFRKQLMHFQHIPTVNH